jgi:hypothetical protein
MTGPTLKLELTVAEIDMAFVLFQAARQDKHTYDEINNLMRKIQDQGRPQLEALAVKAETPPPAPKVRKPKAAPVAEKPQAEPTVDIPDLSDLKFN